MHDVRAIAVPFLKVVEVATVSTRVELDFFSGRPNFSWQLSPDEADELARRVAALSGAGNAAAKAVLGYRGLLISELGKRPLRSVRVRGGMVSVEESGNVRHYRDTEEIERWLLDKARSLGCGASVDEILKGLR